jgi:hypothetical protein
MVLRFDVENQVVECQVAERQYVGFLVFDVTYLGMDVGRQFGFLQLGFRQKKT